MPEPHDRFTTSSISDEHLYRKLQLSRRFQLETAFADVPQRQQKRQHVDIGPDTGPHSKKTTWTVMSSLVSLENGALSPSTPLTRSWCDPPRAFLMRCTAGFVSWNTLFRGL